MNSEQVGLAVLVCVMPTTFCNLKGVDEYSTTKPPQYHHCNLPACNPYAQHVSSNNCPWTTDQSCLHRELYHLRLWSRTVGRRCVSPTNYAYSITDWPCRMTVGEKIEQYFTGRPSSYVPGHTLERLLLLPARPDSQRSGLNMAMHYGQGAAAAIIRALMSANGIRGPFSDFQYAWWSTRLWRMLRVLARFHGELDVVYARSSREYSWRAIHRRWPVKEQIIDIIHKTVFAFVTGYFTDRLLQGRLTLNSWALYNYLGRQYCITFNSNDKKGLPVSVKERHWVFGTELVPALM